MVLSVGWLFDVNEDSLRSISMNGKATRFQWKKSNERKKNKTSAALFFASRGSLFINREKNFMEHIPSGAIININMIDSTHAMTQHYNRLCIVMFGDKEFINYIVSWWNVEGLMVLTLIERYEKVEWWRALFTFVRFVDEFMQSSCDVIVHRNGKSRIRRKFALMVDH